MRVFDCLRSGTRRTALRQLIGGALSLAVLPEVTAQITRLFPDSVALGQLNMGVFPAATLDQRDIILGPGTRIFDEHNRIVLPMTLTGPRQIAYARGALGEVNRIWLLTPLEIQTLKTQIEERQRVRNALPPSP